MGRRAETANAELFAFEIFELVDAFAGENNLVVLRFYGGDQNQVVALQTGLHYGADVNDRRIAGYQRLRGHLAPPQKNRLYFEAIFVEPSHFFRYPDV